MMRPLQLVRLQEADPQSLDARVDAVRNAIWLRNEALEAADDHWYPVDVIDAFVVVRQGRKLLQVPYTWAEDGHPQFGEPAEVQVEYRPIAIQEGVAGALQLVEAAEGEAEGLEWDVTIIKPGHSLNGFYYPAEVLKASAPLFEGVRVFAFEDSLQGHKKDETQKAPRYLAGWIDQVQAAEDGTLTGRLHFLEGAVADSVRTKLVSAWKRGKKDLLALSIDARGKVAESALIEGRRARRVEEIVRALSVDVVLEPAAGGQFTRLVASAAADPEEGKMKTKRQLIFRLLEARRPDATRGLDPETATIEQLIELLPEDALQEALEILGSKKPAAATAPATTAQPPVATADTLQPLQEARLIETRLVLREKLQESKLPELAQKRVKKAFAGRIATEQEIQAAIDEERDYLSKLSPARPQGLGGAREGAGVVSVGASKLDRLQAALDRAFGLEIADPNLRTVKPIGFRGLYNELTLGHDPDITGHLQESAVEEMLQEEFTNATLPRVVANTMYRRLVQDYRQLDFGERRIVTVRPGVKDFKNQEAIRVGYFGDLAAVDPELAVWPELAQYGEEAAQWAVGQRGALVTVTRRHILNDDVGHFAKIASRLGRAARRTFARFVWGMVINNPVVYDGANWFAAAHNNLLALPLDAAGLAAARLALYNQAELTSGERLGLDMYLLAVPVDLEGTAYELNQSQLIPGSANNDANRWFHHFGASNENIVVVPFFVDANDWAAFANPADADIIEVGFLNGQEEPELLVANTPTVGRMFVDDRIQYKIRHEYGGAVIEFRSAVKSVVP